MNYLPEILFDWSELSDTGAVKDAFFAAFHSVPRKISRRHLCKPERIVTNPAIECGNLPAFMPEYADTTFYNSNKVRIAHFYNIFKWKFSLVLCAQVVQKSLEENQKPENSLQISNAKLKSTGTASTNGYMLDQQENTVHSNWIRAASLIKNVSLAVKLWPFRTIDLINKFFRSLQLDSKAIFKNKECHFESLNSKSPIYK